MKYIYFVWKNLIRRKARALLTLSSIFIAFLLFGLLGALNQAFNAGIDIAGTDRLVTIHKVSLLNLLPLSYVNRIAQLDGVDAVTHASWFDGYYKDPQNMFAQFPVDPQTYFRIYRELTIPPEQMQSWLKTRAGAVIGESLARRFGWKVGDRVPVMTNIYTRNGGERSWEFEISGIFSGKDQRVDTTYMLFHYDYFDEARDFAKGEVGWIVFTIGDSTQANEIAKQVDQLFANSPAETKTSTEKAFMQSFMKQFGDMGLMTKLILAAVFFTMLLVTGNTMAQTVRERIPELAVLKTIGFSDVSMLFWVLSESVAMALFGCALALLLASTIAAALAVNLSAYLPGFAVTPAIFVQGLGLAALFGALTGVFPAIQAMRLSIVDALHKHQ